MKSPATSSSSAAAIATAGATESSMDDKTSGYRQSSQKSTTLTQTISPLLPEEVDEIDGGDPAVWAAFTKNFRQVQSMLDRNRVLIQQVNENQQSKIHDNLVKNVSLIQEINGNISKVVSLYSNLSADFSSVFQQQRGAGDSKSNSSE